VAALGSRRPTPGVAGSMTTGYRNSLQRLVIVPCGGRRAHHTNLRGKPTSSHQLVTGPDSTRPDSGLGGEYDCRHRRAAGPA
jgi:hypothetical protein